MKTNEEVCTSLSSGKTVHYPCKITEYCSRSFFMQTNKLIRKNQRTNHEKYNYSKGIIQIKRWKENITSDTKYCDTKIIG